MARSEPERITALEVQVSDLRETVQSLEGKIDSLLELKYKGMGAFWLASAIIGLVLASVESIITDLWK